MSKNSFIETWKDIKCYEGLYQVSNLGRIRSCERNGWNFLEFDEVLSDKKSSGCKTYFYKKKVEV